MIHKQQETSENLSSSNHSRYYWLLAFIISASFMMQIFQFISKNLIFIYINIINRMFDFSFFISCCHPEASTQ
jgi:hypothetical protein